MLDLEQKLDQRQYIPIEDIVSLSTDELLEYANDLAKGIIDIENQIEEFEFNPGNMNPDRFNEEWYRRARYARRTKRYRLGIARRELGRRQQEVMRAAPESKIAAFVRAAREVLHEEDYIEIWNVAKKQYPLLFAKTYA